MIEQLSPFTPHQKSECELLHRIVVDVCGGAVDVLREDGLSDLMARSLVITVLSQAARMVAGTKGEPDAGIAPEVVH